MDGDALPSLLVASGGVVLNLANYLYTKKKVREEVTRQRTFLAVDDLIKRMRETADEVQRHISWESGRKKTPEIYRLEKKCRLALGSLASLTGSRFSPVEKAYANWNIAVFGEGFPVSKKQNAFLPGSGRYSQIDVAQKTFEEVLNGLVAKECSP